MWFDAANVVDVRDTEVSDGAHLTRLLSSQVASFAIEPRMLIDCRDSVDRTQSTATYRLLMDLGLAEVSPVALTCLSDATGAHGTLKTIVSACRDELPAFIIASGSAGTSRLLASALVSDQQLGPRSIHVNTPPPALPSAGTPGFVALLAAIADDVERTHGRAPA